MDDLLNIFLARIYLVGAVAVAALAYVNFRCPPFVQTVWSLLTVRQADLLCPSRLTIQSPRALVHQMDFSRDQVSLAERQSSEIPA